MRPRSSLLQLVASQKISSYGASIETPNRIVLLCATVTKVPEIRLMETELKAAA